MQMDIAIFTNLRILVAMELQQQSQTDHSNNLSPSLQALERASRDLQTYSIFSTTYPPNSIEILLDLNVGTILSIHPSLSKLSQLLSNLRTLIYQLKDCKGYSFRPLFQRQIICYRIYQTGLAIEYEIRCYVDRECVQNLVKTLQRTESEEEKLRVLKGFEDRLSKGFDRDFQQVVLKEKVFSVLESLICDSTCLEKVREQAALAVVALAEFNRDVFVGLVLMGPIIQALISMASCCSIQVLCSLVKLIRIPLINEIEFDGEIPRIISQLSSEDLSIQVAALDCLCQIANFGRKEVIEAMVQEGIIETLVNLQRSIHGDNNLVETNQSTNTENSEICEETMKIESEEGHMIAENGVFAGCVTRFAVLVEVSEGLSLKEQKEFKREILRRIREASGSEAEAAFVVAEVLWGSSL